MRSERAAELRLSGPVPGRDGLAAAVVSPEARCQDRRQARLAPAPSALRLRFIPSPREQAG